MGAFTFEVRPMSVVIAKLDFATSRSESVFLISNVRWRIDHSDSRWRRVAWCAAPRIPGAMPEPSVPGQVISVIQNSGLLIFRPRDCGSAC
jgi:hypothetical protein